MQTMGDACGLFSRAPQTALDQLRDYAVKRLGLDVANIEALLARRTQARADKNWAESDAIRVQQETQANGIVLDLPGDGLSCWGILSVVLATVPTSRPKPPRRKNGRGFAVIVR